MFAVKALVCCMVCLFMALLALAGLSMADNLAVQILCGIAAFVAAVCCFVSLHMGTSYTSCPTCDVLISRKDAYCSECGNSTTITDTCESCAYEFPDGSDYTYCPQCGASAKDLCPSCGAEVTEEYTYCPDCGMAAT